MSTDDRPEFVVRLQVERDELNGRINKLQTFLNTEAFLKLEEEDQNLLIDQGDTMDDLLHILEERLARLLSK